MNRIELEKALDRVEGLAEAGRLSRLAHAPLRYLTAGLFNRLIYPNTRRSLRRTVESFYGTPFTVALPAGTDIYLTGGKTHASEIRLARFLIRELRDGMTYVDVGAHFGYFAGLAARLNPSGEHIAFEPAPDTFALLRQNLVAAPVELRAAGVSDKSGQLAFYQFPARYSEYNSFDLEQYRVEPWLANYPPEEVSVEVVTLDESLTKAPDILKIDVEGLEDRVIIGAQNYLRERRSQVVLEYLPTSISNGSHRRAHSRLLELGYRSHYLDEGGRCQVCADPEVWLQSTGTDSTNLVYLPAN